MATRIVLTQQIQGPAGAGGYGGPFPALRMNAGSASKQIVTTNAFQKVNLDTSVASGGAFVAILPSGASDGQEVELVDLNAAGGCSWGTNAPEWKSAAYKVENPLSPGTFIAAGSTVTGPKANGGALTYALEAQEGIWKLV